MGLNIQRRSNKGMVLVLVIMVSMVMAILTASLLSNNINRSLSATAQVESIKVRELAQGVFWKAYSDMANGISPSNLSASIEGKAYTFSPATRPPDSHTPYYITITH